MYHVTLPLTIRAGAIRNLHLGVSSEETQIALALFDGVTVNARVYSGTNKCFTITKKMAKKAWKNLDKKNWWWVTDHNVEDLIKRHTAVNEHGNTLAMSIPNSCCEETPAEIEEMIEEHLCDKT
jgi:hypothetical protein